jgi:hypothetical protein
MIASWRGVAIALGVAVALVIAVAVDPGGSPVLANRSLVPGFDADRVTELVWERAGQPALHAVRAGDGWELHLGATAPGDGHADVRRADAGAVGEVLAALRGARWHRRTAATPVHATLTVVAGGGRTLLGLGESLPGADQAWVIDGDHGMVVDRWVAQALDRDRLSLQIKHPLAEVGAADAIAIEGRLGEGASVALRLVGRPRQLVAPVHLMIAAAAIVELERALADVELVRVPDAAAAAPATPAAPAGLAITTRLGARTTRVGLGGACPGAAALVALSGPDGDGCVEPAAATAVARALQRLGQPAAAIAERRPIPLSPAQVVLGDGATLDLAARQVAGVAADPAQVARLLEALAAPAEIVALPASRAVHHLVVTDRRGVAITLDLFAEHVVARRGEPIALRPPTPAWDALARPSRELRLIELWREEPTTVSELQIDGVRYQRGQVIGEWTRRPAGAIDAHAVATLVELLAAPPVRPASGPPVPVAHRLTITVAPPAGPAVLHAIEIGAAQADGCPARTADQAVTLPAMVCVLIAALAR